MSIGTDHKLFVRDLKTGHAVVKLYSPHYDVLAPIQYGKPYEVTIDGERVVIHCIKVDRGAVRLGFEAPRSVAVHRIEREQK